MYTQLHRQLTIHVFCHKQCFVDICLTCVVVYKGTTSVIPWLTIGTVVFLCLPNNGINVCLSSLYNQALVPEKNIKVGKTETFW